LRAARAAPSTPSRCSRRKKLEAKGITFDVAYREVPAIGLKIADITDPAGVYIELTEGDDQF